MSSILEALKKLEDEKAARRGGSGNLAGKVAKTDRKTRPTPAWLIPGVMLAVAAVSVLVTYTMMSRTPSPRVGPSSVQSPAEAVPSPVGQHPGPRHPVIDATVADAPGPPGPIRRPEEAKQGRAAISRETPASSNAPAKQTAPSAPVPRRNTAESSGDPLPDLTVVGIAWQKDSALRLAIVNNIPVREGGIVNGATVREILPDRVRFSINGKVFDHPLDN